MGAPAATPSAPSSVTSGSNPTPSALVFVTVLAGGLLTPGPPLRPQPQPGRSWRVTVRVVPSGGKRSPGENLWPRLWSRMVFRALERTPPGQL